MDRHCFNYAGKNALQLCATSGIMEAEKLLKYMITQGTDVNWQDYSGWTPLMDACNANAVKCVQVLLEAFADQFITIDGNNAITIATSKDHAGCLDLLLHEGELC